VAGAAEAEAAQPSSPSSRLLSAPPGAVQPRVGAGARLSPVASSSGPRLISTSIGEADRLRPMPATPTGAPPPRGGSQYATSSNLSVGGVGANGSQATVAGASGAAQAARPRRRVPTPRGGWRACGAVTCSLIMALMLIRTVFVMPVEGEELEVAEDEEAAVVTTGSAPAPATASPIVIDDSSGGLYPITSTSTAAPPGPAPPSATWQTDGPPQVGGGLDESAQEQAAIAAKNAKLEASIFCAGQIGCSTPFFGVNLGGWLVLEEKLLPAMMQGAQDEWEYTKSLGGPLDAKAIEAIHHHWETFVTEKELDELKAIGVTHCRIPVGYWLVDYDEADGFVSGGERYLFRLLAWLKQRAMKAVLDLHALPGAQAANSGSTGRRTGTAQFFLNAALHQRGRQAIKKLAGLILQMDTNILTSDVVVGMGFVNEPAWDYWDTSPGIKELYEAMIPEVRKILPREKCAIMLSFAGPAMRSEGMEWLTAMRNERPEEFAAVFYDAHIFHAYGDNDAPGRVWREDVDSCKTCCRDPALLQPLVRAGLPIIVGEYSVETGFGGQDTDFQQAYLQNQLSLWASTPGIMGSFFWSFRTLTSPSSTSEEGTPASLLEVMASGAEVSPSLRGSSSASSPPTSGMCPKEDLAKCPDIFPGNVLWTDDCHWQTA